MDNNGILPVIFGNYDILPVLTGNYRNLRLRINNVIYSIVNSSFFYRTFARVPLLTGNNAGTATEPTLYL